LYPASATWLSAHNDGAGFMSGVYDILSIRNPAIKELFRLRVGRRRARMPKGQCVVRGRQIVQSISEHFKFDKVFTHESRDAASFYNADKVIRTPKAVLQHVLFGAKAPSQTLSDGDLVIGQIKQPEATEEFEPSPRCLLAVDKIKHPENMGLLLSTAVALKFDGVVFSTECVDPFCYKVLEASQAVAWTLPYRSFATPQQLVELCDRHQLLLCAAHKDGKVLSEVSQLSSSRRGFCLVVGNEADGIQAELLSHCMQVALPMSELVESLNAGVAGGILLHALSCTWAQQWK